MNNIRVLAFFLTGMRILTLDRSADVRATHWPNQLLDPPGFGPQLIVVHGGEVAGELKHGRFPPSWMLSW